VEIQARSAVLVQASSWKFLLRSWTLSALSAHIPTSRARQAMLEGSLQQQQEPGGWHRLQYVCLRIGSQSYWGWPHAELIQMHCSGTETLALNFTLMSWNNFFYNGFIGYNYGLSPVNWLWARRNSNYSYDEWHLNLFQIGYCLGKKK